MTKEVFGNKSVCFLDLQKITRGRYHTELHVPGQAHDVRIKKIMEMPKCVR